MAAHKPEEGEILINTMAVLGILLENLDELEQQGYYARGLKYCGKKLLTEAESLSTNMFQAIPDGDKDVSVHAYMEYYKRNSAIINYLLNLSIDEKDVIFDMIKKRKNEQQEVLK